MLETKPISKVVWAVDVLRGQVPFGSQSISLLHCLSERLPVEIEPVCAWGEDRWRRSAEKEFSGFLDRVDLPNVLPMRFLTLKGNTLSHAVDAIIDYSISVDADMIVTGTHGREGMQRLFAGSFTESLLLRSPIPVLTANPKCHIENWEHILFPTDFSEKSREVYEYIVTLAREIDAKVVLYHRLDLSFPDTTYPFMPSMNELATNLAEEKRSLGDQWVQFGLAQGVDTRFHLARGSSDLSVGLVRASNKFSSAVVAMASQSGPLASALLGSTTREVVRHSSCPILVLHPDAPGMRPPQGRDESYTAGAKFAASFK